MLSRPETAASSERSNNQPTQSPKGMGQVSGSTSLSFIQKLLINQAIIPQSKGWRR